MVSWLSICTFFSAENNVDLTTFSLNFYVTHYKREVVFNENELRERVREWAKIEESCTFKNRIFAILMIFPRFCFKFHFVYVDCTRFPGNVEDSAINFYCSGYLLHLQHMLSEISRHFNQDYLSNLLDISFKKYSKYVLNLCTSFVCTLS